MNPRYVTEELEAANPAPGRLEEALALVWRVFLAFEAPGYCEAGVEEFRRYIAPEDMRRRLAEGSLRMWVCRDGDAVAGVLAARPGSPVHISLLFVDGQYHRQGIARALLERMAAIYRARGERGEITVNSSPYAVEAYRRLGFADTGPERTVNGIRFVPMKKGM